jgi:antitoxin component YwqK of YwqJK toxin-antitoxin module
MKNFNHAFLILFLLIISGCSTDDSTDNPEPTEPKLQTGVFVDSEVAGLNFRTETQSGITNENGEFFYYEGETVTFSVGDIELGSAEGASQLTPISIASTPDASVESQEVKNIAAFLQSLDSDADPSNGITIEAAVVEAISINEIDFTGNIVSLLGEMVAQINLAIGSNLEVVYPEEAATHMAATLGEEYESTDQVFSSFLPTFSNYYSTPAVTSFYWVHETNEDGVLIKSSQYEKYPNRLMMEIQYTAHNDLGLPTQFERVNIRNNIYSNPSLLSISYSEENRFEKILYINANGEIIYSIFFKELDEHKRPTVIHHLDENGNFIDGLERKYNEQGNLVESYYFNSEEGSEYIFMYEYSYTDFGDIHVYTSINPNGTIQWREHFYREDFTLEKTVLTSNNNDMVTTIEFDEKELASKAILDWGWTTIIRYFYENGNRSKEEHYDENGNLTRIDTFDEDGNLISSEAY